MTGWVAVIAAMQAGVLLATSTRYGYHRDELYFIVAGGHPAFGYPDPPPLVPLLCWSGTVGAGAWSSRPDVADADACVAAARATAARAGNLVVWVNNAGVLQTGYAWDQDEAQRRVAFEVNALGTINGTLAALELMRPAGHGHVINVVSLAGLVAATGEALYSATKHAALGFSLGVLQDLRRAGVRDVHVSSVCPDGIWTPMLFDKVDDPEAALSWSGVLLDPERVARETVGLLDRPRPVHAIPRWRGWAARWFDANPRTAMRLSPLVLAAASASNARGS